jgi:hypothetical protein
MRTFKTTGRTSSGKLSFWCAAAALLCAAPPPAPAQFEDHPFGLLVTGMLTTGGELLPDASSPGTILRQKPPAFGTGFGIGAEIRYRFPMTSVGLGLSMDHSSASVTTFTRNSGSFQSPAYPLEDGYRAYAVELTGYFFIPVGGPYFSLTMGGGAGGYWGERVYSLAGTRAQFTRSTPGFGIHVLGGASYMVLPHTSVAFTMKFRDVQFESTNAFSVARIPYGSSAIAIGTAPFSARVEANSVLFSLGVLFTL